jgi:hypothetical protein
MRALNERVKTDMRLPRRLVVLIEEASLQLGVPKNALMVIAAAKLVAELSKGVTPGKKRLKMLDELEEEVQKVFDDAKKRA